MCPWLDYLEEDRLDLWGLFPPGDDDGQLFVCELHGSPYLGSDMGHSVAIGLPV